MRPARNQVATLFLLAQQGEERVNKRRHGRIRCDLLHCGLGHVTDFSASGVCVFHRGRLELKVGDRVELCLQATHITQSIRARVVNIRSAGLRKQKIGLEFTEVSAEITAGLRAVLQVAMDSLTLGHKAGV